MPTRREASAKDEVPVRGRPTLMSGAHTEAADALQAAASEGLPFDEICPACFEPPIAPHLAAGEIGQQISVGQLEEAYARICERKADCLVVEGAGGWMVPLNDEETLADFALTIDLPIILVVGIRLGCINHSLLTQANILSRGGKLAGWVANCIDPSVGNAPDQIDTLRDLLQAPLLQTFSWQAGAPLVWEGSPPRP